MAEVHARQHPEISFGWNEECKFNYKLIKSEKFADIQFQIESSKGSSVLAI